jgi:hypothetical protein
VPHSMHRRSAPIFHICTRLGSPLPTFAQGLGLAAATFAQGLGTPLPRLRRDSRLAAGAWSEWSACDATGRKQRARPVDAQPTKGGAPCPALAESAVAVAKFKAGDTLKIRRTKAYVTVAAVGAGRPFVYQVGLAARRAAAVQHSCRATCTFRTISRVGCITAKDEGAVGLSGVRR